ncbi:high affinity immunoglobulin gamma Fc receptor I-like [Aquarana catesbeiana]|uniref:high affinity immunoglobulin gamma Fc receptor I-like n=1 Tax=Aquarana catesbeiana TaxID=8400 RepID=UPI003CC934E0
MTLTCNTSLSPLRPRTQLKFAFHKDGRNVQEFSSYNQYGVQSTQVKDSGNYSCEVTTATNSVKKRSQEMLVEIKGVMDTDYMLQNIIRLLASGILLLTGVVIFYFNIKTGRSAKTKDDKDAEERVEEHQLSSQ